MIALHNDTLGFTFPAVARQVQQRVEEHIEALVAELPPEWNREEIMEGVMADPMFLTKYPRVTEGVTSARRSIPENPASLFTVAEVKTPFMHAIETTAVLEDPQHLRLITPLLESVTGEIKVILLWPGQIQTTWPAGFFEQTYGSCAGHPIEPPTELTYETDRIPLA